MVTAKYTVMVPAKYTVMVPAKYTVMVPANRFWSLRPLTRCGHFQVTSTALP